MEIAQSLYDFFEIEVLSSSATFADLINNIIQIGVSIWIVMFICRSLFIACTISGRKFY